MGMQSKLIFILCISFAISFAEPWKFALLGDTQWTIPDDGKNPNSVAVSIIQQIQHEMIREGVKFVIAAGDVTDNGTPKALDTRATYAQDLYNSGIGFFPLRGNHEASADAAKEFVRIFPQTQSGRQNATPSNAFDWTDSANTHPAIPKGKPFTLGQGFSSPASAKNLSYAFELDNATFVLLDQFIAPIDSQQHWIDSVLANRAKGSQAFVISHKGIIPPNHADNLFGKNPASDSAGVNTFIRSLQRNGVTGLICGHDHMYDRSLVSTTDSPFVSIQQLVLPSASSKFYSPAEPNNDEKFDLPAFGKLRQKILARLDNQIGFAIVSVDHERFWIDVYSADVAIKGGQLVGTPPLLQFHMIEHVESSAQK